MQYQTGQTLPEMARAAGTGGGATGEAMGLGAGLAMGQLLTQQLQPARAAQDVEPPVPAGASTHDLLLALEKLGELHGKGVLTPEEFTAKKAELLRKLGA